jgi:hypothetical protein
MKAGEASVILFWRKEDIPVVLFIHVLPQPDFGDSLVMPR